MQKRSFSSLMEAYERLIRRPNPVNEHFYNGIFDRYQHPVLTREHIPPFWMYDADPETNPFMMQRLGVNAVLNSGAINLNGKYMLVARVEGMDRKSFFAVAESDSPTEGFRFWDYPVVLPDTQPEETNVYDMRLTQHEDGWIYGVFCSESKDAGSGDLSAAVAAAGIVRTKDLKTWERLPNLRTLHSPQQRNVVLHPEFVDGSARCFRFPLGWLRCPGRTITIYAKPPDSIPIFCATSSRRIRWPFCGCRRSSGSPSGSMWSRKTNANRASIPWSCAL